MSLNPGEKMMVERICSSAADAARSVALAPSRSLPWRERPNWMTVVGFLLAYCFFCSACGTSNPILSSGPTPRVEDCMLLHQATPTRYVCSGKTYTSVQLAATRQGNDKNQ
jgi:hypothetical protein